MSGSFIRIYAEADGTTHVENVETAFVATPLLGFEIASLGRAREASLLRGTPHGGETEFHAVPQRQILIILAGAIRVQVTDGEERELGPGDMLLLEDHGSQGHATEILGEAFTAAVVLL